MTTIDALGQACPVPVVMASKAIAELPEGRGHLAVLVDNKTACENLEKMAEGHGYTSVIEQQGEGRYCVTITVESKGIPQDIPDNNAAGNLKKITVSVGRNSMGHGSDELGAILVKGFLFSLTQLPTAPAAVLFFNSGVLLTVEGSNTIDDLRQLKERGTKIYVCGTCADYYQIKAQIAVGEITNMYGIAEQMACADSVINI